MKISQESLDFMFCTSSTGFESRVHREPVLQPAIGASCS